jgi:phage terminase small subunit
MTLPGQQEKFIEWFIKLRKGAEAARRAGYSAHTAKEQASRLLTNVNVLKEIEDRTKANAMGLDEALSRLADVGRADLGEWLNDDGEMNISAMKRDGATHLIRKVKRTKKSGVTATGSEWQEVTIELELHDAKDANKFIADLHKRAASGKEDDPVHYKFIEGVAEDDR